MNQIKPTDLTIAERALLDAGDTIRKRLKDHGHTERSFGMIADLWSSYINHSFTSRGEVKLRPYDIAQMMGLVKLARSTYGYSFDNFVDSAGYSALAAMLHPERRDTETASGDDKEGEGY
jgi:hypothetical protein